ncbi:MAG: hypothetical protein ACYS32_01425 [Planctomycetota bacterium]|jgi:uncharacterized lipoprotein YehR (DUF1307 family)
MKVVRHAAFWSLLVLCSLVVLGCGQGGQEVEETKPMSEVKAEAEKMDAGQLQAIAMKYKEAIVAKQGDIEKVTAKLKEIPLASMMGEEAKALKADISNMSASITALKARFDVYYEKLKASGGDLTGLQL